MQTALITLGLVVSLALIHWAYVDFRFRYRDGIKWYWLLNPAPPLMWIGRGLFAASILFVFSLHWVGANKTFFVILSALMIAHIISVVLLEVLEPR